MPSKFKQGTYKPSHPEKWVTSSSIIYRSSWEFYFFKWCDSNPSVTKVASEEVAIPYFYSVDQKWHRYFPDCLIEYTDKHGTTRTVMIEIKPRSERSAPKKGKKSEKTYLTEVFTYEKNIAKWTAADAWCKEREIKFMILDEFDLGIKK